MSRRLTAILWAIPLATVAASLAVVVAAFGPGALAGVRVHESEPRSLVATILFPGHLLRELPHLAALACCFAGALAGGGPGLRPGLRAAARAAAAAAAIGALLFAWAALDEGASGAWLDLSQQRGAPDLVGPGVHAAMHAGSDLVLAPLFVAAAGLFAGAAPGPLAALGGLAVALLAAAGAGHGAGDPRALGHGAREVLTAVAFTLPALVAITTRLRPPAPAAVIARRRWAFAAAAAGALAAAVLVVLALAGGDPRLHAADPTRPLVVSAAAHTFEHLLDPVVAAAITWAALGGRRRQTGAS